MPSLYQRSNRSASSPALRFAPLTKFIGKTILAAAIFLVVRPAIAASDASIDRLLSKLPPPEKIVRQPDPVLNDPVAKKTIAAMNARNFPRALALSRQLSQNYPRNAVAHGLHGSNAFAVHQFAEAASEFRATVALQPNNSFGYFCLGLSEAGQGHYATALQNFQKLTRLEPSLDVGWIASSGCAEKLGRRQDSREYAKRAVAVSPGSAAAWRQLARAEGALGNKSAAQRALVRAKELGATRSTSSSARR